MSTYPLPWPSPARLGRSARQLVRGGISLAGAAFGRLADDLAVEGSTETVAFSYRGVDYEVDLSEKSAAALDAALAPYLDAARTVAASRSPLKAAPERSAPPRPRDVREWAKSNRIEVADRGRLPADLTLRYRQAHGQ